MASNLAIASANTCASASAAVGSGTSIARRIALLLAPVLGRVLALDAQVLDDPSFGVVQLERAPERELVLEGLQVDVVVVAEEERGPLVALRRRAAVFDVGLVDAGELVRDRAPATSLARGLEGGSGRR